MHAQTEPGPEVDDPVGASHELCPVCGAKLVSLKCRLYCDSAKCVHRLVMTCSE